MEDDGSPHTPFGIVDKTDFYYVLRRALRMTLFGALFLFFHPAYGLCFDAGRPFIMGISGWRHSNTIPRSPTLLILIFSGHFYG